MNPWTIIGWFVVALIVLGFVGCVVTIASLGADPGPSAADIRALQEQPYGTYTPVSQEGGEFP